MKKRIVVGCTIVGVILIGCIAIMCVQNNGLNKETENNKETETLTIENEETEADVKESDVKERTEFITPTDWELEISEETIIVSGLQEEYSFLFLTDQHIVVPSDSYFDGEFGDTDFSYEQSSNANEVASYKQFPAWIDYANSKQGEELDAVLLGGDIISFPSEKNIDFLAEQLARLNVPYLYTLGNHDWVSEEHYMDEYAYENYLPKLKPLMQNDPDFQTLEFNEIIVVSVNNSTDQVAPEAIERYVELLQTDKKVVVMLHVPLLTQSVLTKAKEAWSGGVILGGGNHGGIYENDTSKEFIDLTIRENSPVVAILAGHVHFADRDMINENIVQITGEAGYLGSAMIIHMKGE